MSWTKEKPELKECVFATRTKIRDYWYYCIWQFGKVDGDDGWYLGWLTGDGEEYGDYEDLKADEYFVFQQQLDTQSKELLPDISKSTENWSKIKDKDKWLSEVRGEHPQWVKDLLDAAIDFRNYQTMRGKEMLDKAIEVANVMINEPNL